LSASTPDAAGGLRARAALVDAGTVSVETGVPVVDHLVSLLARYGSLELALEVEPGDAAAEVSAAGQALGEALRGHLRDGRVQGHGAASVPSAEALAYVALETSEESLVVSNADLSEVRVGGLAADVIGDFLHRFAAGAGVTLHVRLLEGNDPQHVLESIFKALGAALAQAMRPRTT
jgi:imidazoleglycerol-phosphate dehydratase